MKRREVLWWMGGVWVSACGGRAFKAGDDPSDGCPPSCPPPVDGGTPYTNPIPGENARPGDPNWRTGRRADSGELELFTSIESAASGDSVSVMISVDRPSSVGVEIFRLGYYGGAGARKVWSGGPFTVQKQSDPTRDAATALIECNWNETLRFEVGSDWVSGVYLVKATRPEGFKRFAPLVVRDRRPAEILIQPPFNTYQAYNAWGGASLYLDTAGRMPNGHGYQVSYNRPFLEGEGAAHLLSSEYPIIRLLEKQGYDVTYASNADFSRFPDLLNGIGALVIPGHDEYWTVDERAQIDAGLESGKTSLAYFSANGGFWKIRYANDGRNTPYRRITCYKEDLRRDPIPFSTVHFRDQPDAHPENRLFGIMWENWQIVSFPLTVGDANHWLFRGTGVRAGEALHGLVGAEFDRLYPDFSTPPDTLVIMESPVISEQGTPSKAHVVERSLPRGNTVFAAGTLGWASALIPDRAETDDRVGRMSLNVIENSLTHRRAPAVLPEPGPARSTQPIILAQWVRSVEAVAGSPGIAGSSDGAGASARFLGPTGVAVTASGQIVVADTRNHRIRLIENDASRTVRTLAGTGMAGHRDGPGADAMFRNPNGLAIAADGSIYVADADNFVIRRIDPATRLVSTYAGTPERFGFADGPAEVARFARPIALAVDGQGNLFVAEISGHRIRKISASTREVTTYAGNGVNVSLDSSVGTTAQFSAPSAIAVAPTGEVYVFDGYSQYLRRISPNGTHAVDRIAGQLGAGVGHQDGQGYWAQFRAQLGLAVAPSGDILLCDSANFRIRKIVPGSSLTSTQVYTIAGSGKKGTALGSGESADIVAPAGIAIAPNQRIIVSDSYNHAIRSLTI